MSSENETVADIVKEMRAEWAQIYFSEDSRRKDGEYCNNEFAAIEPETVADRIEAAHKREKAELERKVHEHHLAFLAEKARHTETYKDERIRAQDAEIATLKSELTELCKCMKEVLDDYVCKGGASFENGCEGCVDTIGCRLPRWRKALESANSPVAEGGES